jgi:hypothetical protein
MPSRPEKHTFVSGDVSDGLPFTKEMIARAGLDVDKWCPTGLAAYGIGLLRMPSVPFIGPHALYPPTPGCMGLFQRGIHQDELSRMRIRLCYPYSAPQRPCEQYTTMVASARIRMWPRIAAVLDLPFQVSA